MSQWQFEYVLDVLRSLLLRYSWETFVVVGWWGSRPVLGLSLGSSWTILFSMLSPNLSLAGPPNIRHTFGFKWNHICNILPSLAIGSVSIPTLTQIISRLIQSPTIQSSSELKQGWPNDKTQREDNLKLKNEEKMKTHSKLTMTSKMKTIAKNEENLKNEDKTPYQSKPTIMN